MASNEEAVNKPQIKSLDELVEDLAEENEKIQELFQTHHPSPQKEDSLYWRELFEKGILSMYNQITKHVKDLIRKKAVGDQTFEIAYPVEYSSLLDSQNDIQVLFCTIAYLFFVEKGFVVYFLISKIRVTVKIDPNVYIRHTVRQRDKDTGGAGGSSSSSSSSSSLPSYVYPTARKTNTFQSVLSEEQKKHFHH